MIRNKLLIYILLLLCSTPAFCQERLTPLQSNPLLAKRGNHATQGSTRSDSTNTTIGLPFIDDFSYSQKYPEDRLYPNQALWMDSNVYINNSYGINPPTIGVATFDGLNKYGYPYSGQNLFEYGIADVLTSRPINLRLNTPADSIYLSFFYQPEGDSGDVPAVYDSLVLQFKDSNDNWISVWNDTGGWVRPFKQVMIALTDPKYFHPGFQFRFYNCGFLSGNDDNWNLDYVKMQAARTAGDTILRDVAFQYMSQSILKNYTQMPWWQFYNYQKTELDSVYNFTIRNNWNIVNNTNVNDSVYNLVNNALLSYQTYFSLNIDSNTSVTTNFGVSPVPTTISYLDEEGDSVAAITVRTNIKHIDGDIITANDTIYHDQFFQNYYAYDDGTAETAYSLLGNGSAPELAYGFHVNRPDTLRAVQIYFVWANDADSGNIFDVEVWKKPNDADTLYTDGVYYSQVAFGDSATGNGFHTYKLRRPVAVSDSFYIGFLQTELNPLYVGFDVNDNDSINLYYNVGSGFQQSEFHGAIMMRPVLGKALPVASGVAPAPAVKKGALVVYPNPTQNNLNIRLLNTTITNATISIEDVLGQTVLNLTPKSPKGDFSIDVTDLAPGMYFIRVTDPQSGNTLTTKFIKTN